MNIQIEEIKPLLAEISTKIGEGSEFAWEATIRQQYIEGFEGIVYIILGIAGIYAAYRLISFAAESRSMEIEFWGSMIGFIGGAISVFMVLAGLEQAIYHLANPEYQAILDLIKMIN